jgi:hypothetical protein
VNAIATAVPRIRRWLEDVKGDLGLVAPAASVSISVLPHSGGIQVSLTVLRTPDANSLDLCVLLRENGGCGFRPMVNARIGAS